MTPVEDAALRAFAYQGSVAVAARVGRSPSSVRIPVGPVLAWYCHCDPPDFDELECRRCHRRPHAEMIAFAARRRQPRRSARYCPLRGEPRARRPGAAYIERSHRSTDPARLPGQAVAPRR